MSPLETILGKLGQYRQVVNGYRAKCPGHDGRADSLSLTEAEDGTVLIHCFGGCDHRRILRALRLDAQDLFPEAVQRAPMRQSGPAPKDRQAALRSQKVSTLLGKVFPPVRAVVPGVILEGLQLMVGKPKLGKTRLMLDLAVAVASGRKALGTLAVEPGPVLYLSLEDPERRLQQCFRSLLAGQATPDALEYATAWPRLDDGGLQGLERWITCHPGARLIVIDPLKRVRPRGRQRRNAYDEDYEALQHLQDLVNRHPGLAIVVIHHTNKLRDTEDVADLISGSTGLSAGVDGFAILRRQRGTAEASLTVVHRDLEEDREHALRSDPLTGGWSLLGAAAGYRLSPERQAVLEVLHRSEGPMTPKAIGPALGRQGKKEMDALYSLLREMLKAGDIDSPGRGFYTAKVAQDTQVAQNAQEPLTVSGVLGEAEAILSSVQEMARDPAKNISIEHDTENGDENTILSDLSDRELTSSSTTMDVCPECGVREWHLSPRGTRICRACLYQANRAGLRLDEWAELEHERWAREVDTEVRRAMGWYATDCARCLRPLRDRTADEILAGAELCAECRPPAEDLQWLRE